MTEEQARIEETSYQDEPVCPHCGEREKDAWEIDFGGIEGDAEIECGSCGEIYYCNKQVTFYYSTSKVKP